MLVCIDVYERVPTSPGSGAHVARHIKPVAESSVLAGIEVSAGFKVEMFPESDLGFGSEGPFDKRAS